MKLWQIILIYVLVINVVGFFMMGIDKLRAKKQVWRVPEKTLFIIAVLGGSIGTNIGMYTFRHKTKHWYFVVGMPLILVVQIVLLIWLVFFR